MSKSTKSWDNENRKTGWAPRFELNVWLVCLNYWLDLCNLISQWWAQQVEAPGSSLFFFSLLFLCGGLFPYAPPTQSFAELKPFTTHTYTQNKTVQSDQLHKIMLAELSWYKKMSSNQLAFVYSLFIQTINRVWFLFWILSHTLSITNR